MLALALLIALAVQPVWSAQAAPLTATCSYTVRSGDTLGVIARRFNSSVAAIAEASGIDNPNVIRVGQALVIPNCDGAAAPPAPAAPAPSQAIPAIRAQSLDSAPLPPKDMDQALLDRAVGATINLQVETRLGFTAGGTGTVIGQDGRTFLTAFHVVGDTDTGRLYPTREIRVGPFMDWTLRAHVVAVDPEHDLAVLHVDDAADFGGFSFVPVGDSDSVRLGDTVYTLSYPGSAHGSLVTTRGTLLSMLSLTTDSATRYFLTDALASPGSSGGIAINERGEVIGIVSAVIFRRGTLDRLGLPQVGRVTVLVPINWSRPLLD
ncbi:MAG: trypsin-like peptidase domain-containing protein [Anaerolineae bacterium]|nr:trypsin-like peptidase domain-containing protein [Anaerolineae bacterium]